MKITKLNGRYTANRRWGYTYSVTFGAFEWKDFCAVKGKATAMLGNSTEMRKSFLWRDDINLLQTALWAYHYITTLKPMFIYFRNEDDMNQVLMMYALTKE